MMRAARYERYGPPDVLRVVEVPEPVAAAGEVCVRIEAASLNPVDFKVREGALRFVPLCKSPPRTTGLDFAGVIVAVGGGAASWRGGERVFGSLSPFGRAGSCAQSCIVDAQRVVAIPDPVSFEAAACLPVAAGEAVQALADSAQLAAGQHVLIVGAAGGVGHFAVQYARHVGAQVTGVCGSDNVAFVQGLGAHHVVDYRTTDLSALGASFDVVFDAASALDWRTSQRLLRRGGLYVSTGGSTSAAVLTGVGTLLAPMLGGTRARNVMLRGGAAAWQRLASLAAQGVLVPHIARRIGLEGVAQAQADMARGHGRGKIVVLPQRAADAQHARS
jgi:NADPH:quinone reductase-like Zn-dependent oxidoreductase